VEQRAADWNARMQALLSRPRPTDGGNEYAWGMEIAALGSPDDVAVDEPDAWDMDAPGAGTAADEPASPEITAVAEVDADVSPILQEIVNTPQAADLSGLSRELPAAPQSPKGNEPASSPASSSGSALNGAGTGLVSLQEIWKGQNDQPVLGRPGPDVTGSLRPAPGDAAYPYPEQIPPGHTATRMLDDAGVEFWQVSGPSENRLISVGAPASAAALPFVARLAPLAEVVLAAEIEYGPPPLKAIAVGTLLTGAALAGWRATNNQSREALSDEEIAQLNRPLINLPAPQDPRGGVLTTPALDLNDTRTQTPGFGSTDPVTGLQLPGFDVQTPHWSDSILTSDGNADNNRDRAAQRYRQNPSLADPQALEGTSVQGIGTWGYPGQPRGAKDPTQPAPGDGYQEQVSGKPFGLEINVGGTPSTTANGTPTSLGGRWFDDYRIENDKIVLVDAKDWANYADKAKYDFWGNDVVGQAEREIRSLKDAGLEGKAVVEWQVSTEDAADAIRGAISRVDGKENLVIRVVPKKGP
jgi:hypothetical protein